MEQFCLILFLLVVSLWFFANEYNTLFGVYEPTCAMSSRSFNWLVFVVLLFVLWLSAPGSVSQSLSGYLSLNPMPCRIIVLVLLSSLISVMTLKFFKLRPSVVYALIGAFTAYAFFFSESFSFRSGFWLSFLAAPLMAFILSALVRALFRFVMSGLDVHMMKLSLYMRQAVILCVILTVYALGVNWGGLLYGVGGMIAAGKAIEISVLVVVGVVMFLFMHYFKVQGEEPSGIFADFSIYAVISVGLAVAMVLLFFSMESATSLIGLSPVPLSVSVLVFASVAGAEVAQKSKLVENEEYIKEGISFIAAPVCSFVLTSILFYIIGSEAIDPIMDFIVMASSAIVLFLLLFAGYARRQRIQKEATDHLVYTQQQQIYEHSRALNDMELKVVLSENQALHNAVEMKRQEVMNVALSLVEQKEFLESLSAKVKQIPKVDDPKEKDRIAAEVSLALKQRLSYDRDVDSQYFYAQAESLHEDFNAKLSENFPNLTQQEKRLATLLRLGFSSKYIATLMNITPKSVEISRYRLRQKLGLDRGANLVNFIKSI